jgi:type VI secretion system secreted protein VgrG
MEYLTAKKFSFKSKALPDDTFGVVHLKGSEGISKPYEFEVMLITNNLEVDFEAVMEDRAKLIFHRPEGGDAVYNGIVAHFEQLHEVDGFAFYKAYLVPKLWWLSITQHNQVILDKSVPEFLKDVLVDGGLTQQDFEFRLQGSYDHVEYVCQYGESHLNFISRWLEREGIYYFFEQRESSEKVIFTDSMIAHVDLPQSEELVYSPPSGLESLHTAEILSSFHCRQSLMPSKIFMKDYNYRKPSLEITGDADVDKKGRGTVYYYNGHIKSSEEGRRLAKIRAESLLCRREEYRGEGSVPFMLPGFTFTLKDHYRKNFNRKYLIIDVVHEGDQTGYLMSGIRAGVDETENRIYYRNYFTAIPGNVQFRPEITTEQPRISGTIVGRIDSAGSGQYAELDDMGRYKIILPFDLSGRSDGKASAWVRMAQPYAGSNHGMHFPLHKGTEVLLTFIDGDPDRPIIAAAVPNPETPSPVAADNQTMSVIHTGGQNRIAMEDKEGSERILLHSPNQGSYVRIGAPNDPPPPPNWEGVTMHEDPNIFGLHLFTDGFLDIQASTQNTVVLGEKTAWTGGLSSNFVGGLNFNTIIGESMTTNIGATQAFAPLCTSYSGVSVKMQNLSTKISNVENKVKGVENEVQEARNAIATTTLQIGDLDTKMSQTRTEVTGEYTAAIASATKAIADEQTVAAASNRAIAEEAKSIASQSKVVAESAQTIASETKVVAERTETLGMELRAAAEETKSIASRAEVIAETALVTALCSIM